MFYKALDIAKYIIDYGHRLGYGMSCRKVQSTMYFIQADFMVSRRKPLFLEDLLTSNYGVVIKEVEKEYRMFGNGSIPSWPPYDFDLPFSKEERKQVDGMVDRVRHFSSTALLQIIYKQSPFTNNHIYNSDEYRVIPLDDLYQFFKD